MAACGRPRAPREIHAAQFPDPRGRRPLGAEGGETRSPPRAARSAALDGEAGAHEIGASDQGLVVVVEGDAPAEEGLGAGGGARVGLERLAGGLPADELDLADAQRALGGLEAGGDGAADALFALDAAFKRYQAAAKPKAEALEALKEVALRRSFSRPLRS